MREERGRCEDHNDLCSMGIYVMKPYCVIHMSDIGILCILEFRMGRLVISVLVLLYMCNIDMITIYLI